MKILVTGGAGFIGSHLVDRYVDNGHEVIVLDDLSTGNKDYRNPNAEYILLSLSDPRLEAILCDMRPDLINHHAAQANVRVSVKQPYMDIEMNVTNTVRLLRAAASAKVKKIIFASSGGAIYGDKPRKAISEFYSCKPISPYGINKLAAEQYVRMYSDICGYQWIILRYSNVYGPRQNPLGESGIVSIIMDQLRRGERPVIFGDGEQVRDYIHVDDIVEANMLFLQPDRIVNEIFNVGTQCGTSLNDLLQIMMEAAHSSIHPEYVSAKEGDLRWNVLCNKKLKKLGWSPKITLDMGVEKLFQNEQTT
ncbi:NAD-dependent epimerase/dehydratase family protein [Paenibacillus elgii]|uniref:NAD-dependent epimerase/dehydratase family protein n=1 Tax=Paenibacillus elgii TaxID=189691 RepID=UPI00203FD1CD|nr:NAD-dependent epimerase/dehydratase family protein [Paenibacillus elgii]MCM3269662.1 NAD-dependent epimerase/dehydratase family protein [Paenibacillus elgii]